MQRNAPLTAAGPRRLPSIHALLRDPRVRAAAGELAQDVVADVAREVVASHRASLKAGTATGIAVVEELVAALGALATPGQTPVINASGVILHTNLGRAPLAPEAVSAMAQAAARYTNLEVDLASGRRGLRHEHLTPLWRRVLGHDAVVVNNNAAAVLLTLSALARGGDVILSRGEAVEIGGGFRMPEILRLSGARLVEVGTTNRTRLADYREAIGPRTRAILHVHPSNFQIVGFTERPEPGALAGLARDRGVAFIADLGSGALLDTTRFGLAAEPRPQDLLGRGASLVLFSTDKLFGGPQGGVIAGAADLLARVRRHPLMRALRGDKAHLAGIEATLRLYLLKAPERRIPVWQAIAAPAEALAERARAWRARLGGDVVPTEAAVGGGSLPGQTLPSYALRLSAPRGASALARRLRTGSPAVLPRIVEDAVLLDARTVMPDEDDALIAAVRRATGSGD